MKKFLMFLCAMTLVFGMVGTASAVFFEYSDWIIDPTYINDGGSINWQHDINDSGFNPLQDTITSVDIEVQLSDDPYPITDPFDVTWGGWDIGFIAGDFETANLCADGVTYALGEIDLGIYTVNLTAWLQIQDTGLLNVMIISTGGDFYFGASNKENEK